MHRKSVQRTGDSVERLSNLLSFFVERPGPFWGAGKIGKDVLGCWDGIWQDAVRANGCGVHVVDHTLVLDELSITDPYVQV